MWRHIRNLTLIFILILVGLFFYLRQPDEARQPMAELTGPSPNLKAARKQTVPTMVVAGVDRWKAGEAPKAADGYVVERFAEGMDHPRNAILLPNGDILVAESNAPPNRMKGIEGIVGKRLLAKAGAGVASANRITLLRDADGDGKTEVKSTFIEGLNSPFGMALIGSTLYVANTDALLAFPYRAGDLKTTAKGEKLINLNGDAPNNHWTRNLKASADGKKIYIAVGSNSNIAEHGMQAEAGRAQVIEYDIATKKRITFTGGMRNPVGMDRDKEGTLWAVVNERDMLGSDLVPDYLARVEFGNDYGWPYRYWRHEDERVPGADDDERAFAERRPDYALGPHVAALGLAFADKAKLGGAFADGAFIARHGSWNRSPPSGYDVIFVKFAVVSNDGVEVPHYQPTGQPIPLLTGFLSKEGKAKGRPTAVIVNKDGSLLVVDDVGNMIWRVRAKG